MNKSFQINEIVYCRGSLDSDEYFKGIIQSKDWSIYSSDNYVYGVKDLNSTYHGLYTINSLRKYVDHNKDHLESLIDDGIYIIDPDDLTKTRWYHNNKYGYKLVIDNKPLLENILD